MTQNETSFIKCYQSPKGYYFDNITKYYKKCYFSCEECNEEGNYTIQNCLSCAVDYFYAITIDEKINCYNSCDYYFYYNSNNNRSYCTFDFSCPDDYNKFIPIKNQCIDDYKKDENYSYEFRKECHQECPHNISKESESNKYYCDVICSFEYPFEIIENQTCIQNCSLNERENNICKMNFISDDIEDIEIENIKEQLTKGFDTSNIGKGKNFIIKQKSLLLQLPQLKIKKKIYQQILQL